MYRQLRRRCLWCFLLLIVVSSSQGISAENVSALLADRPVDAGKILELQNALSASGFDAGPSDGITGPRTRAALQMWYAARSSEPTLKSDTLTAYAILSHDGPLEWLRRDPTTGPIISDAQIQIHAEPEPFIDQLRMGANPFMTGFSNMRMVPAGGTIEERRPGEGHHYVILEAKVEPDSEPEAQQPVLVIHGDGTISAGKENSSLAGSPAWFIAFDPWRKFSKPTTLYLLWTVTDADLREGVLLLGKDVYRLADYQ